MTSDIRIHRVNDLKSAWEHKNRMADVAFEGYTFIVVTPSALYNPCIIEHRYFYELEENNDKWIVPCIKNKIQNSPSKKMVFVVWNDRQIQMVKEAIADPCCSNEDLENIVYECQALHLMRKYNDPETIITPSSTPTPSPAGWAICELPSPTAEPKTVVYIPGSGYMYLFDSDERYSYKLPMRNRKSSAYFGECSVFQIYLDAALSRCYLTDVYMVKDVPLRRNISICQRILYLHGYNLFDNLRDRIECQCLEYEPTEFIKVISASNPKCILVKPYTDSFATFKWERTYVDDYENAVVLQCGKDGFLKALTKASECTLVNLPWTEPYDETKMVPGSSWVFQFNPVTDPIRPFRLTPIRPATRNEPISTLIGIVCGVRHVVTMRVLVEILQKI